MAVTFRSPNQVVVTVDGYDERPWPDVDFRLSIADTLTVSGGSVQCATVRDLDADTSWLNVLTGVFLLLLPPLGIFFLVENILVRNADAPSSGSGAGCSAAQLIPDEILIPGGQKVVAFYNRVGVSAGGIFAGGTAAPVARTPAVSIQGPTQRSVEAGQNVSATYRVRTDDLLAPLQITWSGEGTPVPQGGETTSMRFSTAGAQGNQVLTKQVAVRVTDRDGLTARGETLLRLHITDPDDGDLPPICRKKPWLPQCQ
jgi:hypothetical protein